MYIHIYIFLGLIFHKDQNPNLLDETDKIQLQAVTTYYTGECPTVSCAPPCDVIKPDWFQALLNDDSGAGIKYFKTNALTEQGLNEVIRFNGWEKGWGEYSKNHMNETTIREKFVDLLFVSAENNNKFKINFSPKEEMHRLWASSCLVTKSPPDYSRGALRLES